MVRKNRATDLTEPSRFSAAVLRDSRLILEVSLMIRDVDALRDDRWERLKEFVAGGRKVKRDRAPAIACF